MKRVIVISTSLRRGSNSDMLAERFAAGAKDAGHEVEKLTLVGKDIQFCRGCMACQKLGGTDGLDGLLSEMSARRYALLRRRERCARD